MVHFLSFQFWISESPTMHFCSCLWRERRSCYRWDRPFRSISFKFVAYHFLLFVNSDFNVLIVQASSRSLTWFVVGSLLRGARVTVRVRLLLLGRSMSSVRVVCSDKVTANQNVMLQTYSGINLLSGQPAVISFSFGIRRCCRLLSRLWWWW